MLEHSPDNDDVGVIIVTKRAGRGMPGFIENPPCRIWIQWTMMRRQNERIGGGVGGNEDDKE